MAQTISGSVAFEGSDLSHTGEDISRDAILNVISDFFSSGIAILALEGKADIGKTHILRQFREAHPQDSIALFLQPHSWFLQDASLLYAELAAQMDACLQANVAREPDSVDESTVRRQLLELSRVARRERRTFYIVIDGMEDLPEQSGPFLPSLIGILPFEFSEFRFLVSGELSWMPQYAISKMSTKVYTVPGFSLEETTSFLSSLSLSKQHVDELYRSFSNGTPGFLASAKRLLETGMSADTLISQLSAHLPHPFRLEWNAINKPDEYLLDLLAVLAFDPHPHTVAELAAINELSIEDTLSRLSKCTFLEEASVSSSTVHFISASFRTYVGTQLKNRRGAIWNKLATYFLSIKESQRAATILPLYLEQAERPSDLLRLLAPTTFLQLAESSDSFTQLQERSQIGFDAALGLKRYAEALRFSMQSSVVTDVPPLEFARAEILARLSLGDYRSAINLAQTTVLKRHRLQLLAAIGRYQKTLGLSAEAEILDAISNLVEQVNPAELGEDLVRTASDLMYSHPQLAIKLISFNEQDRPDERSLDWALLKISTDASKGSVPDGAPLSDAAAVLRSRISDPQARSFSTAMAMLIEESSVADILKQVKALESPGDRLFLLRHWCRHTEMGAEAAPIIDYAVYLSIRTTEYTPTARDYRDLAQPLPEIQNVHVLSSLITAFDIQKETARRIGPTQDYIQCQLLISRAEMRLGPTRAGQRLLEIFYEVDQIADREVRTVCLAHIVASLPYMDILSADPDVRDAGDLSERELRSDVVSMLSSTADHYLVTRAVVEALSKSRPDLACEVIGQLNYESRRDEANADLCTALLELPSSQMNVGQLQKVISDIADSELRDDAIKSVALRLSRIPSPATSLSLDPIVIKLLTSSTEIVDPAAACRAISASLVFLTKTGNTSTVNSLFLRRLKEKWAMIDEPDERLRIGYSIVAALAEHRRELALQFLTEVDNARSAFDDLAKTSFIQCVRIAIRAFSGLLPTRLESGQDNERLEHLIDAVSARSMRTRLWSDLIVRCVLVGRTDDGKRLINHKLRPLLEGLKKTSEYEWLESITHATAALYVGNPMETLALLRGLPKHWKTLAYQSLCRYLVTGMPDGEPFHKGAAPYHLDQDACADLLRICREIDDDATIFIYIEAVADSVTWRHNRTLFSQTQKNVFAETIRDLVREKLLSPFGIKHEGFAILCEAQAARLAREKAVDWNVLVSRGRAITNVSDRVFVLADLALALHSGQTTLRAELIAEAHVLCATIPSISDRLGRLRLVASAALQFDKALARKVLLQAGQTLKGSRAPGEEDNQEASKLVDLAYQLDPDLASSMASDLDGDEGRREARRRVDYQAAKSRMIKDERLKTMGHPETDDATTMPSVSWELLGQLNATRIAAREVPSSMDLLRQIKTRSLTESFPVLSFVVANAVTRRGHADEAKVFLRELFEGTLSACEMARAVITRAAGRQLPADQPVVEPNDKASVIIAAGSRQVALDLISTWLQDKAGSTLYICDPFFGPRDLEMLQLVNSVRGDLTITILTSRKQQEHDSVSFPYEEFYSDYWHKNFSEQPPPRAEFVVVGSPSGELPIHDRWIVSENSGIRLGTSVNGLGLGKDSELSVLSADETRVRRRETEAYLFREKREHLSQKLSYLFFELP